MGYSCSTFNQMPHSPLLRTAIRSAYCSNIPMYICMLWLYIYVHMYLCTYFCPISVCAQSGVENHLRTPISKQRVLRCSQKRIRIVYRHSTLFVYLHICMLGQQDNTGTGNICASHNCITFLVELLVFSIFGVHSGFHFGCPHKRI